MFSDRYSNEMTATERASHFPPPANTIDTSAVEKAATLSAERAIQVGADLMLKQPQRIITAVYGFSFAEWSPTGSATYLIGILADARRLRQNMQNIGKRGHWAYDRNRLMSLLQAERALETKIARGDVR